MIPFASKELVFVEEKKIVASSVRTSFNNESSADDAKIGSIVSSYFSTGLSEQVKHKKHPGTVIDGFMGYESTHQHGCFYDGAYTYFIGEEVSDFGDTNYESVNLKKIVIPSGNYVKFTTIEGLMPNIIIDAWHTIWRMTEEELGGKRAYLVDFQVFGEKSRDPEQASIEIYIGIVS
jgi:predicted transcriptional regulator YdeE